MFIDLYQTDTLVIASQSHVYALNRQTGEAETPRFPLPDMPTDFEVSGGRLHIVVESKARTLVLGRTVDGVLTIQDDPVTLGVVGQLALGVWEGRAVMVVGAGGVLSTWDAKGGELIARWRAEQSWLRSVAIGTGGGPILTSGARGAPRLWGVQGHLHRSLGDDRHAGALVAFAAVAAGDRVLTANLLGDIEEWTLGATPETPPVLLTRLTSRHAAWALLPGGHGIVIGMKNGSVISVDRDGTNERVWLEPSGRPILALAPIGQGEQVVLVGFGDPPTLLELDGRRRRRVLGSEYQDFRAACADDTGSWVFAGTAGGQVVVWNTQHAATEDVLEVGSCVTSMCFRDAVLWVGLFDGSVRRYRFVAPDSK